MAVELPLGLERERCDVDLDHVADAVETFCDGLVARHGAASGLPVSESDFEVDSITIGGLSGVKAVVNYDTTGDGLADTQKDLWSMPAGALPFGEAVRQQNDVLIIKGYSKWQIGGTPMMVPNAEINCACAVM